MANRRILIIDDEAPVRQMLRATLEREGHQVSEANDGEQGLRVLQREPVDLLITDLIMPGKEGLETIGEVRGRFPDLPVIAISGGGRIGPEGYLELARAMGARHCLAKPFTRQKLVEAVNAVIGAI